MSNDAPTYPNETRLAAVTADELDDLKRVVNEIRVSADTVMSDRRTDENSRYCKWDGQSEDGFKHADDLGEDAKPFEGASDSRERVSDDLTLERVELDVAAATRAMPTIVPTEASDVDNAAKVATYLQWLIRSQWGRKFREEVELISQYRNGDTPAVGFAMVEWCAEKCLHYVDLVPDEIAASAAEAGRDPTDAIDLVQNPLREDELAVVLGELHDVKPAAARKAAKALIATGAAKMPVAYTKPGIPKFWALRAYEDIFYPENALRDLSAVPVVLRRWLTEAEVRADAARLDWNPAFVDELLGHEGKSAFDDQPLEQVTNRGVYDLHDGQFEVLTMIYPATDEDGVPGMYMVTFSNFCETAATPRELYDRKHGGNGIVAFPREVLTRRLNDSRGIPSMTVADQNRRKLFVDSYADHVQVAVNPPVKRPRGRAFFKAQLAPFGELEIDGRQDISYMEPPQYPAAADSFMTESRRALNDYWGRFDPKLNPDQAKALTRKQHSVDLFLTGMAEVFKLVIQLAQQYMTDEDAARVVGLPGMTLPRTAGEIQGGYDVSISFDVDDLDPAKKLEKPKMILDALSPHDRTGAIPNSKIIRMAIASVYPQLIPHMPDDESAASRIEQDEKANVVMALNGTEPQMPQKIDAAQLRLSVLQREIGVRMMHPEGFAPMTDASSVILKNRLKYLTQQAEQVQNAQIGRVGARPVDLNAELAMEQAEVGP